MEDLNRASASWRKSIVRIRITRVVVDGSVLELANRTTAQVTRTLWVAEIVVVDIRGGNLPIIVDDCVATVVIVRIDIRIMRVVVVGIARINIRISRIGIPGVLVVVIRIVTITVDITVIGIVARIVPIIIVMATIIVVIIILVVVIVAIVVAVVIA